MMVPMTRRTATARILLVGVIMAGCGGPEPSGSPAASLTAELSASAVPTAPPSVEPTTDPTLAPTLEPTIEPDPTPDDVVGRRTEIEISEDVVDRPGVPGSLRNRYWWFGSDVGLIGSTAQLGLPWREFVVFAADGLVVSTHVPTDHRGTDPRGRRHRCQEPIADAPARRFLA
jgi:hypothetical protein